MILPLLLLAGCSPSQSFDLKEIDRLAQARDIAGLSKRLDPATPLSVLRTNGAYDCGRFGWRAFTAGTPEGRRYIVLSTYLTSEDIGELLFVEDKGRLRYVPETDAFGMRVVRQELTADFELSKSLVRVKAKTELAPLTPNQKESGFTLRLGPNYRVSGLVGADGRTVPFSQAGGIVFVSAPRSARTLTMAYEGVVDKPGYAGSIDGEHIQLSNESWWPTIARRPAPYSLSVAVPPGWVAVGQGERTTAGGRENFDMKLPTSVWSFSAEPFQTFTRTNRDGRAFDVYSRTIAKDDARRQTELNEPILAFYESKFAPYPFRRWGVADVATYGGGALEAYSFATYGEGSLIDEDAHEPSHTWWGGILPNTYLESFWNESFADFSEGLYRREVPIGDRNARRAAFADLALDSPGYARVPVADGSCFIGQEASDLGYGKGAHVLAMLESLLGTDRTTEAMRRWIAEHPKGEAAGWPGFERTVLSLYPEMDLAPFFAYWLHKPGVPTVSIRDLKWDGARVTGSLPVGTPRMPLEFVLVSAAGRVERRLLDTKGVATDGTFSLASGIGKPARVLLDPYHRALRTGAPLPPTGFFESVRGWRVYRDPATPAYLAIGGAKIAELPKDLDRMVIVGNPKTTPAMAPLLAKAGMTLAGDSLSWNGTTVDLRQAGGVAVVDLGGGKRCGIVLGTANPRPKVGRASLALFDSLGRFLTGVTPLPSTEGKGPADGVFAIE